MSKSKLYGSSSHSGISGQASLTAQEVLEHLFPNQSLLSELDRMSIRSGNRVKGMLAGKRRSSSLGGSQEFADYRPYSPGDDVRRIDWNVYGRTGKAYMRQYWDEQELQVSLYVDVSRSMHFGERNGKKLPYALRLAACLGYMALGGDDRVSIKLFRERIVNELQPLHGRAAVPKLFQFLGEALSLSDSEQKTEQASDADFTNISMPFNSGTALPRRPGSAWVLTDAMFDSGVEETIVSLLAAGQKVVLVHLLSQEEIDPELSGELKLVDSELGTDKDVAIGHKVLKDYKAAVTEFQLKLKRICAERGAVYVFVNTSTPLEETIRHTLLSSQLLNN
ncbi:DUF58 domain-containing protein [Paenibacillus sinopodophylli]|uniref:DUF58 domain-containing protein n=1 Tax=Paenibacillus sinopodophylli TaxID=1837342 RepID=UPI001FE24F20|nr:DUF58 domain-containing protein [Paenibacillus sinopodophylli]